VKLEKITEVGIAVKDLEKATRLFVSLLGAEAGEIITVRRYHMRYRMCRLGNVDFELMEPLGGEGVIAKFLESKGEGLHHLAFKVDNLEETLSFLKKKGVKLIDETPKDLNGTKYVFVHPSSFLGVMFELIQYSDDADLP
jgi:methylmalonyl-CoA epimerase